MYEAVATMFVAQMHEDTGMVLNPPMIINIMLTVLAASIGAANVTNTGKTLNSGKHGYIEMMKFTRIQLLSEMKSDRLEV